MSESRKQRSVSRIVGKVFLVIAAIAILFGIIAWPPGGLMFALPYVFFLFAIIFGGIGLLVILIGRLTRPADQPQQKEQSKAT